MIGVKLPAPTLVSRHYWAKILGKIFEPLSPVQKNLARGILFTFHNRHVGITPKLVVGLLPSLQSWQNQPAYPWNRLYEKLGQLTVEDHPGERAEGTGLYFTAGPLYTLFRLVLPLTAEACDRIGQNFLFCEDRLSGSSHGGYSNYDQKMHETIVKILREPHWQGPLTESAMTLSGYSRSWKPAFKPAEPLPQTPAEMLPLLFELKPDFRESARELSSTRVFSFTPNRPVKERLQSGVSGVRMTTRESDFNRMLMSEFNYPRLIRLERLLSSGFTILEREPKQEKMRHLLLVGMLLPDLAGQPAAAVAKACWLQLSTRLALALRRNQLDKSEFRWIEPAHDAHYLSASHLLTDLPKSIDGHGEHLKVTHFANHLRCFPHFTDSMGQADHLIKLRRRLLERTDLNPQRESRAWLGAVWDAQRDHPGWREPSDHPEKPHEGLRAEDFGQLYVMLFGRKSPQTVSQNALASYVNVLRLDQTQRQNAVITLLPAEVDQLHRFHFRSRRKKVQGRLQRANLPKTAGKLMDLWREDITRELFHG